MIFTHVPLNWEIWKITERERKKEKDKAKPMEPPRPASLKRSLVPRDQKDMNARMVTYYKI